MKARLGSVVLLLAACSGNTHGDPDAQSAAGSGGVVALAGAASGVGAAGKTGAGGANAAGGASGSGNVNRAGNTGVGGSGVAGVPEDIGSGACHDFSICGGDLLGKWRVDEACFDPALGATALCPGAVTETSLSGTVEFRADGTMSSALHAEVTTTLPASCAAQYGFCAEGGQGNLPDVDCERTGEGDCACSNVTDEAPSDASFSTTPAGLLTVVRDGSTSYSYFCRTGDETWLRAVDKNGRINVTRMTKM